MAWSFGDGFDLYAAVADAVNGYWDSTSGFGTASLVTGRFAGSRAFSTQVTILTNILVKSSAVNDAVHHIVVAINQPSAISGTNAGVYFQLADGATGQCCIVFRSDGAILLTSGTSGGTVLDTYTGAFTANNTWYAFEIEVVINNTTGSWAVRKNGNTSNDHALGSLNTRVSANNYANRLNVGNGSNGNGTQFDDLFWRSDASSVAWMGDIRCYTRMPASDQSVQFSQGPNPVTQAPWTSIGSNSTRGNGSAHYIPFVAAFTGSITGAALAIFTSATANMKTAILDASNGGNPGIVLGSATVVANPVSPYQAVVFGTPVAVTKGTTYYLAVCQDANVSYNVATSGPTPGIASTALTYASFPANNPTSLSPNQAATACYVTISLTSPPNAAFVGEPQEDGTNSYVSDHTAGHADFYNIGTITSTPATTVAVTTRGYVQKSDAGNRTLAVQIKSGSTTVASPTLVLSSSGFQWAWRTDTTDPNTGAAWTAAAVNAAQIGPSVVS